VPRARSDEDLDRELIEFLNELRVMLPGVQVLFAFLLTVPFTNRFREVTGLERGAYFFTLLCTTVSTVLLITPSAYHRLRWREHDKERMLRVSNVLAIVGMAFLAAAMTGAVFLISDHLFGTGWGIAAAAPTALVCGGFWYGLPITARILDKRSGEN
jgi:hypothetical protein